MYIYITDFTVVLLGFMYSIQINIQRKNVIEVQGPHDKGQETLLFISCFLPTANRSLFLWLLL